MNFKAVQIRHSKEEIANYFTHALGLLLALAGLVVLIFLVYDDHNIWRKVSFVIYGTTVLVLFAVSTLYHAALKPGPKRVLRIADHIAIYFLIAGTYTPFMLLPLRGSWGWTLLAVIWGLALTGTLFKLWFTGRFSKMSTAIYLGMGWLAVIAIKPMIQFVPAPSLGWLVAGGLFYSLGVVFYNWRSLPYHHAVWHLFVLAGSACHFISISFYL